MSMTNDAEGGARRPSIRDHVRECIKAGYDEAMTVSRVKARVANCRVSAKRLRQLYQDLLHEAPPAPAAPEPELLFDVVIYEIATRRVDAVIGKAMPLWDGTGTGRNTADLRKQTGQERVNDRFDVAIVPTGKYEKDQVLTPEEVA